MSTLSFLESEVQMPLMNLPVRSVIVTLEKSKLLISPGSMLTKEQLESLKDVTDIIAPNLLHSGGIPAAAKIFPLAKLWTTSLKRNPKNINWTAELNEKTWNHQNELPMVLIQGMPKVKEVVFYHKETKSLIVTDLCFNLIGVSGIGPWIILNLFGTYKKFGISKLFAKFVKDTSAFEESISKIMKFDFENIIVSHGTNVMGGAKEKLQSALALRGFKIK